MGGAVSSGRDNNELIDNLMSGKYIRTREVERVFRALDRAEYMTPDGRDNAYKDLAWRNGPLHLSSPCIYSEVMEALELRPGLSFLNIGSGTGYLSTLAGLILGTSGISHGVEVHPAVVEYARKKISLFYQNSHILDDFDFCEPKFYHGNGLCLKQLKKGYDRVYCGAGCPEEFEMYFKRLIKVGGILVMPLNDTLLQVRRVDEEKWSTRDLLSVSFATLRIPSAEEAINKIKLDKQTPVRLLYLARAAIRESMREGVTRRHPELREAPRPPPPAACPRRICIPLEHGGAVEGLNVLHDLDNENGANEMNALLSLVISMGQSRVAGALRFDRFTSSDSEEEEELQQAEAQFLATYRRNRDDERRHRNDDRRYRYDDRRHRFEERRRDDQDDGDQDNDNDNDNDNPDNGNRHPLADMMFPNNEDPGSRRPVDIDGPPLHDNRTALLRDYLGLQDDESIRRRLGNSLRNSAWNSFPHSAARPVPPVAEEPAPAEPNDAADGNEENEDEPDDLAGYADRISRDNILGELRSRKAALGRYLVGRPRDPLMMNFHTVVADGNGMMMSAQPGTSRGADAAATATETAADEDTQASKKAPTRPDLPGVPSEVEIVLGDKMAQAGSSTEEMAWEETRLDTPGTSEEDTDTSNSKAKRQKLDSGLGETTTSDSSPEKTKSENSDTETRLPCDKPADDPERSDSSENEDVPSGSESEIESDSATDDTEGFVDGARSPSYWSVSAEELEHEARMRRQIARGGDARRARLSYLMKQAVRELPLPHALKKFVNLGRCFEF